MNEEEKDPTYLDNMTLDDIAKNDDDMARDAIKNASRYTFQNFAAANDFTNNAFVECIQHLGVPGGILEKGPSSGHFYSKDKRTRIEHRVHYQGDDLWRNGVYLYRDDVLAYFIGKPQLHVGSILRSPIVTNPINLEHWVVTNAPMEKRIMSFPSPGVN